MALNENPVIRGTEALWGIGNIYSGLLQSARRRKTGEDDMIGDGDGQTVTKIFFDDRYEWELELICQSATPEPDRGDALTIDSDTACFVLDTELQWEWRGWKRLRITAHKFANISS